MVSFLLGHPVYKALSSKTRCHVKRLQVVVKYTYEYKIFMRNIGLWHEKMLCSLQSAR